jgi:hypothetical protein
MWYDPDAFSLGIRDVIGAWLVCLVVAVAFFGHPLVGAAWDASVVQRYAAAGRPSVPAPVEICARYSLSIELPQS